MTATALPNLGERFVVSAQLRSSSRASAFDAVDRTSRAACWLWVPGGVRDRVEQHAFRARAARIAAWQHPGHVPAREVAQAPDGTPFAVIAPPAGVPLVHVLARGGLSYAEATAIGLALGDALTAAHAVGVAHGHLGVEDVIVDGTVARIVGLGLVPANAIVKAADQAALASIWSKLVTECAAAVPLSLGAAIARAQAPGPANRYASLAEFHAAVVAAARPTPTPAPASGPVRIVRVTGAATGAVAVGPERATTGTRDDATIRYVAPDAAAPAVAARAAAAAAPTRDLDDATEALPLTTAAVASPAPPAARSDAPPARKPRVHTALSLIHGMGARTAEETKLHRVSWTPPAADKAAAAASVWRAGKTIVGAAAKATARSSRKPSMAVAAAAVLLVAVGGAAISREETHGAVASAEQESARTVDPAERSAVLAAVEEAQLAVRRRGFVDGDAPAIEDALALAGSLADGGSFAEARAQVEHAHAELEHQRVDAAFVNRKLARLGEGDAAAVGEIKGMIAARRWGDANRRINQLVLERKASDVRGKQTAVAPPGPVGR